MGPVVYVLGFVVTLICAVLLLQAYERVQHKLLLWSGLCFVGLCASNGLLIVDLVLLPDVNLYTWRLGVAAAAMLLLVYGLVWEGDR